MVDTPSSSAVTPAYVTGSTGDTHSNRVAHCRRQRRSVTAAAHDERHQRVHPVPLRLRHVDRVGLAQIERRLLHVADDADDRVPIAFCRPETKPLADRVAISELAPGE